MKQVEGADVPEAMRRLVLLLLTIGFTLAVPATAQAHDVLEKTTPADGTTVQQLPGDVALVFSDQPLEIGLQVVVTGPTGNVAEGLPTIQGREVRQAISSAATAGEYTVAYRVTSDDGHPVSGSFLLCADRARWLDRDSRAVGPRPPRRRTRRWRAPRTRSSCRWSSRPRGPVIALGLLVFVLLKSRRRTPISEVDVMVEQSQWMQIVEANPAHSTWFVKRFRDMAAAGQDIDGEARLVDAMVPAGLASSTPAAAPAGSEEPRHVPDTTSSGSTSIRAHRSCDRGPSGDPSGSSVTLAELDLAAQGRWPPRPRSWTLPATSCRSWRRAPVARYLQRLRSLKPSMAGSSVGFGAGVATTSATSSTTRASGLEPDLLLAGWDLRPFRDDSDFLVRDLRPA